MPELPEVETVRRGLSPVLVGQAFHNVECRRPDLRFPFPERFAERLRGISVLGLERRAKYLIAHLSSGDALVMHLGMTGRFLIERPGDATARQIGEYNNELAEPEKHAHAVFQMREGARITYSDPRRFGFMLLIPEREICDHPLFRNLGVEPLSGALSAQHLAERARGRKTDLKAFLMDQRNIAGLGNIYVCEALHRAGLKPSRGAGCLAKPSGSPTPHAERLVTAIQDILEAAIVAGGSTLRDYRQVDGTSGGFQATFLVYGREGDACLTPGCRGIVRRSIQAGRSSFFCPSCQR